MQSIFNSYGYIIVFLHLFSAVVWIGGMIAIRLSVHSNLMSIRDTKVRLEKTLSIVGNFFNIVIPLIFTIFITATIMIFDYIENDSYIAYIKEGIFLIMTINFIVMYIIRKKAQNFFDKNRFADAKLTLKPIPNILLPINIVLGVIELGLGVSLRGF